MLAVLDNGNRDGRLEASKNRHVELGCILHDVAIQQPSNPVLSIYRSVVALLVLHHAGEPPG
jgi:hypothetical protein